MTLESSRGAGALAAPAAAELCVRKSWKSRVQAPAMLGVEGAAPAPGRSGVLLAHMEPRGIMLGTC